ncbi:DMT family transporter [Undibacterium sp. RuTC16W]|uniref:DMT family transporter n=1 Tax=Undibacterium sp. RuTC16W TaxID=3413048 RepID=UPI003BF30E63
MQFKKFPALKGAIFALLAAILFGASTPFVQGIGVGIGGWMTAALLYAGAATAGFLLRSDQATEASLQRQHWPRLFLMALFGAVAGPAALAWGLQHTNGVGASLMLTLEAVFTVLLSYLLYREQIGKRVLLAVFLLSAGGALLVVDQSDTGTSQMIGLLAVMSATIAWGIDNTLSRALADVNPGQVIFGKAVVGASCSLLIALALGQTIVSLYAGVGLFLIGGIGYGLSLRFYLLAQREFGSARTGSIFAAAPFIGAAIAFGLGERQTSPLLIGGALLMIAGVVLHLVEEHEHDHEHDYAEHEHAHTHDDGHHTHTHEVMPRGAHNHRHTHEPLVHRHPHTPDLHHGHGH